jgi:hypothetical protein
MVLYLARKRCGLTLRGIAKGVGGMAYNNVSTRVRRFEKQLASDRRLRETAAERL